MKKILEEGKNLLYSRINRANVVTMLYYQVWILRFNIIHIKILATFYTQRKTKTNQNPLILTQEQITLNNQRNPRAGTRYWRHQNT